MAPPEVVVALPLDENEKEAPLWKTREETPSFMTALSYIWSCRRFVAKATLAGMLLTVVLVMIPARQYESTTRLMPPDKQSMGSLAMIASTVMGDKLGPLAGSMLGIKTPGELIVGILRSRTVTDRLIDQFDLKKVYGTNLMMNAEKDLEDQTDIEEDKKSGIITIVVRDRSPQRAADMARAYSRELNSVMAQLDSSDAHRERVFLEGRLVKAKTDLDTASRNLSIFASKNTTIDLPSQGKAMVGAAAILQGQLMVAQSELSGYEQIFTENNVRVRALRAQVAELQKQLQNMVGTDQSMALQAQNGGENSNGIVYPAIRELPLLGVPYFNYYREAKIQEAVYEILTKQYELAKVEEAKELPSVRVLDQANLPERPSYPKRTDLVIIGTFFFAFASMVYLLASFRWAHMSRQHPAKMLGYEIRTGLASDFSATRGAVESSRFARFIPFLRSREKNGSDSEYQ